MIYSSWLKAYNHLVAMQTCVFKFFVCSQSSVSLQHKLSWIMSKTMLDMSCGYGSPAKEIHTTMCVHGHINSVLQCLIAMKKLEILFKVTRWCVHHVTFLEIFLCTFNIAIWWHKSAQVTALLYFDTSGQKACSSSWPHLLTHWTLAVYCVILTTISLLCSDHSCHDDRCCIQDLMCSLQGQLNFLNIIASFCFL